MVQQRYENASDQIVVNTTFVLPTCKRTTCQLTMPVRLRMAIHGRRHNRIFHLVAINQRTRRDAKPMELLGIYDPTLKLGDTHKTVKWSVDRIKYWLGVGALPSKSVVKLLECVSLSLLSVLLLVLK